MTYNYQLTPEDVRLELLTDTEKAELNTRYGHNQHEMLIEALKFILPRIPEGEHPFPKKKGEVKLTANDVHSILLQPEENEAVYKGFREFHNILHDKVYLPLYYQLQNEQGQLMDNFAREAGFEQFDENEQRTGLRNHTALHNSVYKDAKQRAAKYDELARTNITLAQNIHNGIRLLDLIDEYKEKAKQCFYRNILQYTRPRMNRTDANGKDILSPDAFLKALETANKEEQQALKQSITTPIIINQSGKDNVVHIDKSIALYIKTMNACEYKTCVSCSGILADHPGYRYVQDDEMGRYKEGECIMFNKQGSGAYLSFWKDQNGNFKLGNSNERIEDIRRIASEQGWIVEDTEVFFMPSIRIGLPLTYDGTGKREILHEAGRRTNEAYPGLKDTDFLAWLEKRRPYEIQVENEHGGVVLWTDQMILKRWHNLTQELMKAYDIRQQEQQNKDMPYSVLIDTKQGEIITVDNKVATKYLQKPDFIDASKRLSDIHIYPDKQNENLYFLRGKVDGIKQLAVKLTPTQGRYWEGSMLHEAESVGKIRLAAECFMDKLCNPNINQSQYKNIKI